MFLDRSRGNAAGYALTLVAIAGAGAIVAGVFSLGSESRPQRPVAPEPVAAAEEDNPSRGSDRHEQHDGGTASEAERFWPRWRGPRATGVAPHADPPVEWSETENVRWKIEMPGEGHSTPIVWGERILLTAAAPTGPPLKPSYSGRPGAHDNAPVTRRQEFMVLAVRRDDGEILWRQTVRETLPHEGGHRTASYASNSPVTDGERVYAFFGSRGLYCLDAEDGEVLWSRDFGRMHTKHGHGEGASPALHGDTLIVNWDHEGQSFIAALDKRTGERIWKRERDEPSSWATPIVVERSDGPQVIVSGTNRIRAYDLTGGDVIWACGGLPHNIVASPVSEGGMVFAGASYQHRTLLAIRLDGAQGDITGTDQVAWSTRRATPYVPSPLLYGEALYYAAHYQAVLSRVDAATGEGRPGAVRLPAIRELYASPVGAAGRVYATGRSGTTVVLRHDDRPEVLAVNRLDEPISASAAIVGDELFLRGESSLYCIAEE